MNSDFLQYKKWKFTAGDQTRWFVRGQSERPTHVLMKAFLWAIYLPDYPNLTIEVKVGDRYKPDVVAMDGEAGKPLFWGESGRVSPEKIADLVKRYRHTHFAVAKWAMKLNPVVRMVEEALAGVKREAPFDVLVFPKDSLERFMAEDGTLNIQLDEIGWHRFERE